MFKPFRPLFSFHVPFGSMPARTHNENMRYPVRRPIRRTPSPQHGRKTFQHQHQTTLNLFFHAAGCGSVTASATQKISQIPEGSVELQPPRPSLLCQPMRQLLNVIVRLEFQQRLDGVEGIKVSRSCW